MEELHLPSNIKVHWAAAEVQNQFLAVQQLGVRYALYTAFPFVERMVFGKGRSPIMPLEYQKKDPFELIPEHITSTMKHVIQDSGLFTLMFGADAGGNHSEEMVTKWYDNLVEFSLQHSHGATCVEVDCQKILGVEKAWEFRERMKNDLPNNRIINVFHLEDGQKGLDRLIEFSEYIAISVPELRFAGKKNWVYSLTKYIKTKKPTIDIHLLGCTELKMLRACKNLATSSDSTTYTASKRFGFLKGHHTSRSKTEEVKSLVGEEKWNKIREINNEMNTNILCLSTETFKREYQEAAGNQDYYSML